MSYSLQYLKHTQQLMGKIVEEEMQVIRQAAELIVNQIKNNEIVHIYGPGGHSNIAAQEVFFRAGGLMHMSAILDEGTLLSSGALRSMQIERITGYAPIVLQDYPLKKDGVLIIVNAYGINAATIDSALYAKELGMKIIGISSKTHAEQTPLDHPARHITKKNLNELVDVHIDSKILPGDAVISIDGVAQLVGAVSSFANNIILNCLTIEIIDLLSRQGIEPPIWKSGNITGGDEWNAQFINQFKHRIKKL
ncbi:SIS domain-containing protein [Solibacillus sp. FSL K6-1554]|uniref:SIS domain-containing protein n=1 Tax=Solibacillus sp. FSL K6-1554 TaxID=2921472 RepID=UPI0030F9C4B4